MTVNSALAAVVENQVLSCWGQLLRRRPDQLNAIHEADAELVPLPGGSQVLAVTSDTVAEEIALGLYEDPETMGWVAVAASLSDLAAVGADPLGLTLSVTLPGEAEDFQRRLARGIAGACDAAGTHVLGGDTNIGAHCSVTGTAVGLLPAGEALTRIGCRPGDWLFSSGPLGAGAALAAGKLLGGTWPEEAYRPTPRLCEGRALRGVASAVMDTSDGLVATLDQLARLNDVALCVDGPLERLLSLRVEAARRAMSLPAFPFLAGHHGEFELVFTVSAQRVDQLERRAATLGWTPLRLGVVEPGLGVQMCGADIDGARVRNLLERCDGDLRRYVAALCELSPRD